MDKPAIEFLRPTSLAFARMKRVLFEPFSASKWFVLGFTAWLAALLDGGGSGGGGGNAGGEGSSGGDLDAISAFFARFGEWAQENMGIVIGVGSFLALGAIAIFVLLLWLSSRGKFMFLDNAVHNRAEVRAPWSAFGDAGWSLFLWRLGFTLVSVLSFFVVAGAAAALTLVLFEAQAGALGWLAAILGGAVVLLLVFFLAYVWLMLEDFVIPIMYRDRVSATAAWKRFLVLHRARLGSFLGYALWIVLLSLAAFLLILVLGAATCCVGFLVMIIPYIGTVFLLPVVLFFRFLGPEFLRQFGPEYDVLGEFTPALPGGGDGTSGGTAGDPSAPADGEP